MADFKLADLECKHCGKTVEGINTAGWVVELDQGKWDGAVCPECYDIHGAKEGSQVLGVPQARFLFEEPKKGNFKPVKSRKEITALRDCGQHGSTWWDLELSMFEILDEGHKCIKLNVQTGEYDEVWLEYVWEDNRISAINVSGDRPKRNFELNIYQKTRLFNMGLTEHGSVNKDWTIALSPSESEFVNIARVTSHILQFGWLLQSHKVFGLGPIIDTDI